MVFSNLIANFFRKADPSFSIFQRIYPICTFSLRWFFSRFRNNNVYVRNVSANGKVESFEIKSMNHFDDVIE